MGAAGLWRRPWQFRSSHELRRRGWDPRKGQLGWRQQLRSSCELRQQGQGSAWGAAVVVSFTQRGKAAGLGSIWVSAWVAMAAVVAAALFPPRRKESGLGSAWRVSWTAVEASLQRAGVRVGGSRAQAAASFTLAPATGVPEPRWGCLAVPITWQLGRGGCADASSGSGSPMRAQKFVAALGALFFLGFLPLFVNFGQNVGQ